LPTTQVWVAKGMRASTPELENSGPACLATVNLRSGTCTVATWPCMHPIAWSLGARLLPCSPPDQDHSQGQPSGAAAAVLCHLQRADQAVCAAHLAHSKPGASCCATPALGLQFPMTVAGVHCGRTAAALMPACCKPAQVSRCPAQVFGCPCTAPCAGVHPQGEAVAGCHQAVHRALPPPGRQDAGAQGHDLPQLRGGLRGSQPQIAQQHAGRPWQRCQHPTSLLA